MSAADSGFAGGAHRMGRGRSPVRLGQHFLTDSNLLAAIVRDAAVDAGDVVLEIGGGEGALTARLAAAARHLHVIELDRGLAEGLSELSAGVANVSVTHGDAMRLDLSVLDPPPTAVVSNLPYSIATPVLVRTIVELREVRRWTVMVQREIADRLRAGPGSKTYGAPSVLVQLACEVELLRAVDRAVFTPRPRVDSALLGLTRHAAAPPAGLASLVHGAFAHRRKPLAGSLELAGGPTRAEAHEALAAIGIGPNARAEQLAPEDFARLYERLERR